ncbi:Cell surface protein [Methanosarcina siciliae C2J]|uniref:Cell surface protein n=1 Tax=Methanosarcina siciliae C2J TaxID=1434118 RepID=A0A0E3PPQ7_9EURY|nr:Cell surface protein [Methanosarcina siciliae C2J]
MNQKCKKFLLTGILLAGFLLTSFLLTDFVIILAGVPAALYTSSAPIVYVAGDGSGDFNCDGTEDHVQINQALNFLAENPEYTTVYLRGPFTYVVDDTLLIGSNTTLEGDSDAKIKLVSNAKWSNYKPMIKENNSGSRNITICGFTIDGNREGNTNVVSGKGYYNLIHLSDCQNISVYNMYLTNNHGDGLKTENCSNVKFYNNEAYLLGHDVLYAIICSDVEAYGNTITCRTNSGLRLYNTNNARFHNNNIRSEGSGGAGIEVQKEGPDYAMDDIEVCNNVIYNTALSGILVFGSGNYSTSSANVHIHHNQIYDTGIRLSSEVTGGILSEGFNGLIENNVIDGAYGAGIVQDRAYYSSPDGSGYVITVRNNIITNTCVSPGGEGYGICNMLTDTHLFVLQNNSFYNNAGGDYTGVEASPSDINSDPQYADRDIHDYHLKSKAGRWNGSFWVNDNISSPCIDAGYSLSDFSNEPEPNGDRINIGPYGNTLYASKSEFDMTYNSSDSSIDGSSDVWESNEEDNGGSSEEGGGGSSHSSGSSSGSGGGAGGSPEPAKNIEVKELSQVFITNGKAARFDFTKNVTCVVYVSFDAKKTVGKTTAIVEMLKNKSALVSDLPPDDLYKFFNLWIGNGGYGTSDTIENPEVCFKVEKAWIQAGEIDQASITLNRYNDNEWYPLVTRQSGEDDAYLYFTAETPGFSPFAITGKVTAKETATEILSEPDTQGPEQNNESMKFEIEEKPEQTGNQTGNTSFSGKKSVIMPGFEIIYCIVGLLGVFMWKRG